MAQDIIDDRLIGAVHLRALTRSGLDHDPVAEHTAVQAGTFDALLESKYDGDLTFGEILRLGDLGVGTLQQLGGEVMILDGEVWLASADGSLRRVDGAERTPFAVVCHFAPTASLDQVDPLSLAQLCTELDSLAPGSADILAFRVDGVFRDLELRSVHRQVPPYPSFADVVSHQTQWSVSESHGTVMGFRFPDSVAGIEVPGYHLHFLSDDRTVGGHVLSLTLVRGHLAVTDCDSLHVELPPGVALGTPGAADIATMKALESPTDQT